MLEMAVSVTLLNINTRPAVIREQLWQCGFVPVADVDVSICLLSVTRAAAIRSSVGLHVSDTCRGSGRRQRHAEMFLLRKVSIVCVHVDRSNYGYRHDTYKTVKTKTFSCGVVCHLWLSAEHC